MELPLSKREWELYKDIKRLFEKEKNHAFTYDEYHKYEEWLSILRDKGVLSEIRADGAFLYYKNFPFDDFENWLVDNNKKAKKMSRREWKIAVASAIIGAMVGSIMPTVLTLII